MTNGTDFFDNVGGGSGAPSAILKNVGDYVHGEILDMYKKPYIPFSQKEPAKRADGTDAEQLVIVLQTQFRNWQNVSRVPVVDPNVPNSPAKDPSEDDGKRAVYVPEGKNIQFAIGRAVQAAGAKFVVGGTLGVKVVNLRDTGKGNPLKEHEAIYKAPAPSAPEGFFGGQTQGQVQAPAPQAQAPAAPQAPQPPAPAPQAPAAQDPFAPAPQSQQAPAQTDPWTGQPVAASQPPF